MVAFYLFPHPRLESVVQHRSPRNVHVVDAELVATGNNVHGVLIDLHGTSSEAKVLLELGVPVEHGLLHLRRSLPDGILEQVPHPLHLTRPVPLDERGQVGRSYSPDVCVLEGLDAPLVHPERVLEPQIVYPLSYMANEESGSPCVSIRSA
jgi:hypothetical protein